MPGANPYSMRHTLMHPLSRMVPDQPQLQAYHPGQKHPPSLGVPVGGPVWETATFSLAALETQQARVNAKRMFTMLGLMASATQQTGAGGFRVQVFDTKKGRRLADRGVLLPNFAGSVQNAPFGAYVLLREPYVFDQPDSQVLLTVQNMETVANSIQLVLYGAVMRFNALGGTSFPGGPITSLYGEWSCPQ